VVLQQTTYQLDDQYLVDPRTMINEFQTPYEGWAGPGTGTNAPIYNVWSELTASRHINVVGTIVNNIRERVLQGRVPLDYDYMEAHDYFQADTVNTDRTWTLVADVSNFAPCASTSGR